MNFSQIREINFREFFQRHRFAKVYECEKYFFLEFAKVNVRKKKIKNKNFNSFYLFQTANLVKLVQILKRFSQELSS